MVLVGAKTKNRATLMNCVPNKSADLQVSRKIPNFLVSNFVPRKSCNNIQLGSVISDDKHFTMATLRRPKVTTNVYIIYDIQRQ